MEDKNEIINFRTTKEFKEEIKMLARKQHITVSALIVLAINNYIKQMESE